MKLHGKIMLVTGGNSGIGRAIALRDAAEGARVAITGRDLTKGARVLAELQAAGAEAAFIAANLGDEAAAADLIAAVAARFGGIDVVVNNAGSSARYSDVRAEDGPGERLRKLMRVNFDAAYHVATHSLPAGPLPTWPPGTRKWIVPPPCSAAWALRTRSLAQSCFSPLRKRAS